MMTEEEMRQALFGSAQPKAVQAKSHDSVKRSSAGLEMRNGSRRFVPRLKVTLRVGNEFEGATELFFHECDTLSTLQAELDAKKMARKKFRYIELVSVGPAN